MREIKRKMSTRGDIKHVSYSFLAEEAKREKALSFSRPKAASPCAVGRRDEEGR
jgi:hypothetical protein